MDKEVVRIGQGVCDHYLDEAGRRGVGTVDGPEDLGEGGVLRDVERVEVLYRRVLHEEPSYLPSQGFSRNGLRTLRRSRLLLKVTRHKSHPRNRGYS